MTNTLGHYGVSLFTGERVRLRPLQEDDLPALTSWWNNPEWMLAQRGTLIPSAPADTIEMFRMWSANKDPKNYGFSIEDLNGETLVGHITLWGIDPSIRAGNLGIIIGAPHIGQGFGPDAIRILLRFAFEELGLNKVELTVWEHNSRAISIYESIGFIIEGRRRAAAFHQGRFWDQIQMGILASEYEGGAHLK